MKDIIPKSVFDLNTLFKDNGFDLYVVGGAVRDFVMNITPKDFDLSSNAHSDDIIRIIEGKYKYDLHGKDFFVVVVYTNDCPEGFEIATFRSDVYDGKLGITRNPKVTISDIDGDCDRRDLTFNAMYYDIDNDVIIDKKGGQSDIKNKICRFVGEPLLRITEDPQRMVRIIRFASRFSFEINDSDIDLIRNNIEKLDIITRDRIAKEFVAMFSYGNPFGYSYGMVLMHQCGILAYLFKGYDIDSHVIHSPNMEVHFACMLRGVEERLFDHMIQTLKFNKSFVRRVLYLRGLENFSSDLILTLYKKKISVGLDDAVIGNFISLMAIKPPGLDKFLKFKPSVNSKDLMDNGFSGVELGLEQQRLECVLFKELDM